MTRDAKIGLLLGLVFIFIIAFVINGLPSFSGQKNNNELTTNMVGLRNDPPAIGAKERKIINPVPIVQLEQYPQTASGDGVHFDIALPGSRAAADKIDQPGLTAAAPPAAEENRTIAKKADETSLPRKYTISEGDSLAAIAKKFYGAEDGGKKVNVALIFQANRKVLKLPDEIYVGQELIIPPLPRPASGKNKSASVFSGSEFTEVESIGKKHLPANSEQTKQYKWHTVQQGENLWQIATAELGNGNRYGEIVKLNADVLESQDSLEVGMRLKMPAR